MTTTFSLSEITIHRIVEQKTPFLPVLDFLPGLTPERLDENRAWLEPRALEPETGRLILCFQSYILRTPDHTVLVDSCIGNDKDRPTRPNWHMKRDDTFMRGLAAHGLSVADIDVVMCTHLHADHVGWNTRLEEGRWVPTFPNARYLFSDTELAHWTAQHAKQAVPAIADSVLPIVAAKRAEMVQSDHAVGDYVRLLPTPGHTGAFLGAGRQDRRGGRDHGRFDPLAAAGALSRAVDAVRLRPRSRGPDPPRLPGAVLRHRHALLHGAFPIALGRPHRAVG